MLELYAAQICANDWLRDPSMFAGCGYWSEAKGNFDHSHWRWRRLKYQSLETRISTHKWYDNSPKLPKAIQRALLLRRAFLLKCRPDVLLKLLNG
jgi:hypothetical protein